MRDVIHEGEDERDTEAGRDGGKEEVQKKKFSVCE